MLRRAACPPALWRWRRSAAAVPAALLLRAAAAPARGQARALDWADPRSRSPSNGRDCTALKTRSSQPDKKTIEWYNGYTRSELRLNYTCAPLNKQEQTTFKGLRQDKVFKIDKVTKVFDMPRRWAGGQREYINKFREICQAVWLLQGNLHSDLW